MTTNPDVVWKTTTVVWSILAGRTICSISKEGLLMWSEDYLKAFLEFNNLAVQMFPTTELALSITDPVNSTFACCHLWLKHTQFCGSAFYVFPNPVMLCTKSTSDAEHFCPTFSWPTAHCVLFRRLVRHFAQEIKWNLMHVGMCSYLTKTVSKLADGMCVSVRAPLYDSGSHRSVLLINILPILQL